MNPRNKHPHLNASRLVSIHAGTSKESSLEPEVLELDDAHPAEYSRDVFTSGLFAFRWSSIASA